MTFPPLILPVLVHDLSSPDPTSPPGSNQTDLATSTGSSLHSGGLSNMLVVTSSVGMLHRVHSNTTHLWPAVPLNLVLVVASASLQHRLVNTTTTSNYSDHGSVGGGDDFFVTTWQLHPGPLGVRVMGNYGGVVTAGPCELATISDLLLEIADNSSLGHVANGHHVANGDMGLLTTVHELSGVHALGSHEQLLLSLVPVWVTEVSNCKGSTTARVMDDIFDNSLDVSMPLREVHSSESRLALPVLRVGSKDGPSALTLGSDDTTHFSCRSESSKC